MQAPMPDALSGLVQGDELAWSLSTESQGNCPGSCFIRTLKWDCEPSFHPQDNPGVPVRASRPTVRWLRESSAIRWSGSVECSRAGGSG